MTEAGEKVKQIRANILAAQSRQKSYTDKRRRPLEFEVVTTYTSEFPRWKVYVALASKAS
jgi:hypothetical protein